MKKIDRITFWGCLILFMIMIVMLKPVSNLDELWNFNISRNIVNGLVPYKDISMVSTPLLGFIMAIPLKIFGQELFVYRMVSIIIYIAILIVFYKILIKLDIKKEVVYFSTMLAGLSFINYLAINYNVLALLFVIMITFFEIQYIKNNKWRKPVVDVVIGILIGLTVCTKQTVGLFVGLVAIVGLVFYVDAKSDLKRIFVRGAIRICGAVIPGIVFLAYLAVNGATADFFNYSVLGIKTFSNKIPYSNLLGSSSVIIKVMSIVVPVVFLIAIVALIAAKIKNKENNIFYIFTVYGLAMFTVAFPIADGEHFIVAMIIPLLLCIYAMNTYVRRYVKFDFKYVLEFTTIFTMLFMFSLTLWFEFTNLEDLGKLTKYRYQNHYNYVYVSEDLNNEINVVNEYMKKCKKDVYILDARACLYMIPLDRYNKDYDMFCLGNLGADGEEGQIKRIKNEDAIYIILHDDNQLNWQNPNNVRAYIKENLEFVETISKFDVYKKK